VADRKQVEHMTEFSALISRAADRDESAWAELVAEFGPMMRSIAAGFRLTAEEAADAAQTTWMRLLSNIGRIREPERIAGWLATTMRRECAGTLRRRGREQVLDDWMAVGEDDGDRLIAGLVSEERNRTLWRLVDRLPANQRRLVLALAQESEPSYKEVASAMAIPIGSIGPTRARALNRLKHLLAEQGLDRTWGLAA
jgi:RNA polymerase sigma factor (sigma-70 family)